MTTAAFEKAFEGAIQYSHLDVFIQAWYPQRKKDIQFLENFQRKATRMTNGSREINFEKEPQARTSWKMRNNN